jgi:hypothetical protein
MFEALGCPGANAIYQCQVKTEQANGSQYCTMLYAYVIGLDTVRHLPAREQDYKDNS